MKILNSFMTIAIVLSLNACGSSAPEEVIFIPAKIVSNSGFAYTYAVPELASDGDSSDQPNKSKFILLEDGKVIGPAHSSHEQIRSEGKGRWSHWQGTIYFSSSDGTSPTEGKHQYVLRRK
jgi:hypothetical protein